MTIDIVTICKNSKSTIKRLLDSIELNSEFIENFIVIDGGSTDGTLDILNEYCHLIKTIISEPDKGISDAFNKGIQLATSDFILLLNSDDYLLNKNLGFVKPMLLSTDEFVSTTLIMKSGDNLLEFVSSINNIKKFTSVYHPGLLVSRLAYNKYGLYDLSYSIGMDYEFIVRAYLQGAIFRTINVKLVVFADGGVSRQRYLKGIIDGYRVRKKYFNIIFPGYEILKLFMRAISILVTFLNLQIVFNRFKYRIYKFIFE